ncbi:flagellar filament capping protein FliD [Marinilactibacillus sp. XAAS-LB27]|uniref:flagellar filament capping protein FliD n=1 Tax=Marinilactibacillus sp. XAAS-LB27 TaxID=3114538 RepID=UPI002E192817|nr:flagellar filament capping protein FliD [Marinilactibacillus sp. XAAS-LB27]
MSAMNIMGTYSGIDMATVEQLIQAESSRGVRFTNQKDTYQKQQTAWKDVNGRLDNLYTKLDNLKKPDTFNSKMVSVSSDKNISATAKSTATTGEYELKVLQLATSTRITGGELSINSLNDEMNIESNLVIDSGIPVEGTEYSVDGKPLTTVQFEVEINAEDTLKDIRDKINAETDKSKVKASIVDNRLILTHVDSGEKSLSVSGGAASSLGLEDGKFTFTEGKKALFEIDGLSIEKDSNTITDVLDGVTLNLQKVHGVDESDKISITNNTDKAAETMQELVDQYNSLNSFIDQQTSVGDPSADNNKTGTLVGDSSLTRLQSSLRNMFTRNMDTSSESINNLQDLGVEIDRYGKASFNKEKFVETLEKNPNDVEKFFHDSEMITTTGLDAEGLETTKTETKLSGFANSTRSLVNEYISSSSGIIKTKNDTYDRLIKDVNQRIETFNARIATKREQYIKQFTALDTAMMQAESQLQFMMGQMGSNE